MADQERRATHHHHLPAHEVLVLLESDAEKGLTSEEAARRLERFGLNVLPKFRRHGPLLRFLFQFHHPLIYVLLAATAVTAWLGEWVDAGVIFGVVLVNAIVGFIQESRAEVALEALVSMMKTEAVVRRDGRKVRIPSAEIVPGDLILLESGDKVPADLRLTALRELRVDESALTGESVPVEKTDHVLSPETVVADRKNMAFSGTLVTYGQGRGVAVGTGAATELGRIHQLIGETTEVAPPLTKKLAYFRDPDGSDPGIGGPDVPAGSMAGAEPNGNFHGSGRTCGGRDPGRPAGGGYDHPGDRGGPDGPAACHYQKTAGSGDAR